MIIRKLKGSPSKGSACLIVLAVLFVRCGDQKVPPPSNTLHVAIDSIQIRTDSLLATSYTSTALVSMNKTDYLFLSDPFQRIISVIDATKWRFLFNIRLKSEGPDETQNLGWIQCIGRDSIIAVTNDYFYLINWAGKVVKRTVFNRDYGDFDFTKYKIWTTSNQSVLKKDSVLLLAKVRLQTNPAEDAFYTDPLIGSYNYITDEIKDLPVFFPDKFRAPNSNYDLQTYPRIVINADNIFYTFPFSSSVFGLYQGVAKELFDGQGEIAKPLENKYSNDLIRKATYMEMSSQLKALLFDDTKKLIYQLLDLEKKKFGDDTEFRITVRDERFNIIGEIVPIKNLFPTAFVRSGKIYFRTTYAEVQNRFQLISYEITSQ